MSNRALAAATLTACLLVGLLPQARAAAPDGPPVITSVSVDRDRIAGGAEVIVEGERFAPGTFIAIGDAAATDVTVESASRLRFRVPPQTFAGGRTLTIRTSAGVAQRVFHILGPRLDEIPDAYITSIAGGIPYAGDGLPATSPDIGITPHGIVFDRDGNMFVSDVTNNRVRRVDARTGVVTTYAGTGAYGYNGDGIPAVTAALANPSGLAWDRDGNLLIADQYNRRIRRVDSATGMISSVWAGGQEPIFPIDVEMASNGDLYLAHFHFTDYEDGALLRVDATTGQAELIESPYAPFGRKSVAKDAAGRILALAKEETGLFVVTRIDPITREVEEFPIPFEFTGDPVNDLLVAPGGQILFVSEYPGQIFTYDLATGQGRRLAGRYEDDQNADIGDGGDALQASFYFPQSAAFDGEGRLVVADTNHHRVRRISLDGIVSTVAGRGEPVSTGDGGPATSTRLTLFFSSDLAVDDAGNVFVTEPYKGRVRRVDAATGVITTVAGNGGQGFGGDGGPATEATFSFPSGVAVDGDGNLYIADANNHRVRRVDAATGVVTTIAGTGEPGPSGNGGPAAEARLFYPSFVVFEPPNRLYVEESGALRLVNLTTGMISEALRAEEPFDVFTLGRPKTIFYGSFDAVYRGRAGRAGAKVVAGDRPWLPDNGDGGKARKAFVTPAGLAVDRRNNLFIAHRYVFEPPSAEWACSIRRVDAKTKRIVTVAGGPGRGQYSGDGSPALGAGFSPTEIAFDRAGNLYIVDTNGRVRVVKGLGR